MITLLALITVIDKRAADAFGHGILTEFALFIVCEDILFLALTTGIIALAGEAVCDKEIAILTFVTLDIVIFLACEADV